MARFFEIPVVTGQVVEVAIEGQALDIFVKANDRYCEMDLAIAGQPPIASGVRIVGGIDLTRFCNIRGELNLSGLLMCLDASGSPATPTPETLGRDHKLYYITQT